MTGKAVSFLAVLALFAGIALAAPQPAGMNGQMGEPMGGGQMGGQMHGRRGDMNIDQRVARMKSDLNLNDKQADRVKDLMEKQRDRMQSWRESHAQPTRSEMMAHRRQMMAEMRKGMKKILTHEQFKKWETMRKERMRRKMGHGGPQGPPQN